MFSTILICSKLIILQFAFHNYRYKLFEFADNLKDLINEKELSLKKIGKESGFTSGQLSEYLHGAYPTVSNTVKLAKYFNCSLDYLFGIVEKRNYSNYVERNFNSAIFIERYQELLKLNKITHWQFAKQNQLTESALRHWKSGHKPLVNNLQIIAINLNGSIDYLIGRIDKY